MYEKILWSVLYDDKVFIRKIITNLFSKKICHLSKLSNLSKNCSKISNYLKIRLVKGLSSGRKAARQGYATALTHVLIDFDQVKLHEVFEMMEKFHAIKGSFKGQV